MTVTDVIRFGNRRVQLTGDMPVEIDYDTEVVTVKGVRYAFSVFDHMGLGPLNVPMMLLSRDDGVVTVSIRKDGYPDWQPIETAPVPAFNPERAYLTFRCLLQSDRGWVFEGHSRWVRLRGKEPEVRWYGSHGRWEPSAKYWMPLPEPHIEETKP